MAAILMVCMVSFVFCTGMRGDMSERIPRLWGSTGPAVIQINGRSISRNDLDKLRTQRNLANIYMKHCADLAFKNVSKEWYELNKNVDAKDEEARRQRLAILFNVRSTLSLRRARLRYFDGGVKFDDLVEFKLWQAEADRLKIYLQDEHVTFLFNSEFFISGNFSTLSRDDIFLAQREAQRENRDASDAYVRRAVAEEFRVRIAQYATLGAQPFSMLIRQKQQGFKFAHPDMPDELRAPLTLAQLWDFYKAQRAEFNVSLIPVHVDDFAKKIQEPTELQKEAFFKAHKDESYDPSSDNWSLEIPSKIKIEYVTADPTSGPYFDQAKAKLLLEVASPLAWNPLQFPQIAAATYVGNAQANKLALWRQYKVINPNPTPTNPNGYRTTGFDQPGSAASIAARLAGRHPQAAASVVAGAFLTPMNGFDALAAYQAWGATKHAASIDGVYPYFNFAGDLPDFDLAAKKAGQPTMSPKELDFAAYSELQRRRPLAIYQALFPSPNQFPLDLAFPYLAMNPLGNILELEKFGEGNTLPRKKADKDGDKDKYWDVPLQHMPDRLFTTYLTIETVQPELQDMIARRTAEEWAQANILFVKEALKQAGGDADKFRRELRKHVKEMKLTYGPPDDLKGKYYDRFTIDRAEEFDVLKQSYLKYMDQINLFEGRDLTPGKKLKAADYYKMFFDPTESFSASAKYQAMPWPPEVKPNSARDLQFVDARMIKNIAPEDLDRFQKHLNENDPNRPSPPLYLYKYAERPILFWRTAEINANRPADYGKIVNDLAKTRAKLTAIEKNLDKEQDKQVLDKLKTEEAELKKKQGELKDILNRVTDGWKFERARKEGALPAAQKIAALLIDNLNDPAVITEQAGKLKKDVIVLANLSQMHRETVRNNAIDYFPPSLPKDKIVYPRDDMMQQILSLLALEKPIETGNKDLDEVNKNLFEVAKQKQRAKDKFVQILADKPRSIFYVAAVTSAPRAEPVPFLMAMAGASYQEMRQDRPFWQRDYFVDRAQEQEAKLYRADFIGIATRDNVIRGLAEVHKYKLVDSEARKAFDERSD